MASAEALKSLKIKSARNRCKAYERYVESFASRTQSSPAIQDVLKVLRIALEALEVRLTTLPSDPDLQYLNEDEIENRIHYWSKFLVHISQFIGLVENADVTAIPGELAPSLCGEVRKFFENAELIVVAEPELNYSIMEISRYLRNLLGQLECDMPADFPTQIFRVAIPKVEYDQALLHCILAHEMGHPLYQKYNIEAAVSPIAVDPQKINQLYGSLNAGNVTSGVSPTQTELPFGELFFKKTVTDTINKMIASWVEELSADLFGLLVFGPAFVLASIHLVTSIDLLSSGSYTHPPARMRLNALLKFTKSQYPFDDLKPKMRKFLGDWQSIAEKESSDLDRWQQIARDTLEEREIVSKLCDAVLAGLPADRRYSLDKYKIEVDELTALIDAMIPPCEYLHNGTYAVSSLPSILNAAWESYLGGLVEFRKCLPGGIETDEFGVDLKYNEFLIKSMELNQIRISWEGARDAIVRGKNQGTGT